MHLLLRFNIKVRFSNISEIGNFSFLATMSPFTISVETNEILVFDEVRINVGNNYNPSNGQYTG